jgi:predicted DNA-binding transcriptional regulator AlpA
MGRLEEKEEAVSNQHQRYYTAREAQAKLGLSKAMFFRKVNEGLIPKVVPPGMKQGLYPRRDIDALALSMNLMFEQYDRLIFSRSTPADQVEELKIGIRCFGSDFITPLPERIAFQQKSEFTFHSLKVDGQVVGYVSLFRFPPDFLDDLLTGRHIERDITVKEVLPFVRLEPFNAYIDVFAIDPTLPSHLRHLYAGIMVARFIDLILNLLANGYQITRLYTVTATIEGDKLVQKLGFRRMEGKSIAPGRTAYEYALDPQGIERLRAQSQREREADQP